MWTRRGERAMARVGALSALIWAHVWGVTGAPMPVAICPRMPYRSTPLRGVTGGVVGWVCDGGSFSAPGIRSFSKGYSNATLLMPHISRGVHVPVVLDVGLLARAAICAVHPRARRAMRPVPDPGNLLM